MESDVKRYSLRDQPAEMSEFPDGEYVRYEDYEKLAAAIKGSYVTNCYIEVRDGDGPLVGSPDGLVKLDRYTIVPRERDVTPDELPPGSPTRGW